MRRRWVSKTRTPELTEGEWLFLTDEFEAAHKLLEDFTWWELKYACHGHDERLRALWQAHIEAVLEYWLEKYPGTRPRCWWRYSAPRIPVGSWERVAGTYLDGRLPEGRLQVGGAGSPPWDAGLAIVPWFELGLPASWVALDEKDPPRFESQAHYLRRHGLLMPGEARKLKPEDFEHEEVDILNSEVLTELAENRGQ